MIENDKEIKATNKHSKKQDHSRVISLENSGEIQYMVLDHKLSYYIYLFELIMVYGNIEQKQADNCLKKLKTKETTHIAFKTLCR